tara:strand:+ start:58 stop:318 length:261 start_codon:yes stop_codon:yes gene_type:complete
MENQWLNSEYGYCCENCERRIRHARNHAEGWSAPIAWEGGRIIMTEERMTKGSGRMRLLRVFGKKRYMRFTTRINIKFTNVRMRRA